VIQYVLTRSVQCAFGLEECENGVGICECT
jgi:hypothetical protein